MNPRFFPKPLALHHVGSDQIGRARLNGERKWNHQTNPLFSPRGSLFIMLAVINSEGARLKRGKKVNTSYLLIISYSKLSWPKRTEWQLSLLYFPVVTCLFVWFNIHLLHFYPSHRCNINIHLLPFYPYHRCNIFLIIFFSCCIFLKKTQFKWNKQKKIHLFFFQINNNFVKSFYINYQEKKIVEKIDIYHGSFVQAIVTTCS